MPSAPQRDVAADPAEVAPNAPGRRRASRARGALDLEHAPEDCPCWHHAQHECQCPTLAAQLGELDLSTTQAGIICAEIDRLLGLEPWRSAPQLAQFRAVLSALWWDIHFTGVGWRAAENGPEQARAARDRVRERIARATE